MEHVLKLSHLTKKYGKQTVVKDVSLTMEPGHIYGLIGPNGAGKTTIMKMIAGLTSPDSGSMELFGEKKRLDEMRSRMSFMIEAPFLDNNATAYQNMMYMRYVRGVAKKERIGELLEFVGLSDTGKKQVKDFSLGMRQRLGIGMALLSRPEFMVLDEPVNGLDPEGIVEIRNMLKKLCSENGISILISSHLLSELSELCTDYVIINQGSIVESLSAEALSEKCRSYLSICTNDMNGTVAALSERLHISGYKVMEQEELRLYECLDDVESVSKAISDSGYIITRLVLEEESLEAFYLSLVAEGVH
ncbi:MAG: ATP-binding cassette domain-containing protein [Lachnospiraceae bacterium]|nr:ATP-binding cassette domain-containing protein [Lachnospiraceae bacterium]